MDYELPRNDHQHFFKYTTAETASIIIGSRSLRWSSPLLFNDPFDHQGGFDFPFTGEALAQALTQASLSAIFGEEPFEPPFATPYGEMLKATRANRDKGPREVLVALLEESAREIAERFPVLCEKLNTEITAKLTRSRVFCVTERRDNLLMWAHYADEHKGVAFQFRRLEHLDHRFTVAQPVQYSDEPVSFLGLDDYIDKLMGMAQHDLVPRIWDLAYQKHADWRYEEEWRVHVSLPEGKDPGPGYSNEKEPPELFEAIYLGCRMDAETMAQLVPMIRANLPDTQIFQAKKRKFGIGLEFKPVE